MEAASMLSDRIVLKEPTFVGATWLFRKSGGHAGNGENIWRSQGGNNSIGK